MRKGALVSILTLAALLAGCGGGGGSDTRPVLTPPAPEPTPEPEPQPEPEPETIHKLNKNHTFTASGAFSDFTIDPGTGTTGHGQTSGGSLTVSYNAQSKSYTVSGNGHSQTFRPADIDETTPADFTAYVKESDTTSEQLLLLKTALDGVHTPEHVAMGMWQRTSLNAGQLDSAFDAFVYGFDTPAAAMPRSGGGSFAIDVFGMAIRSGGYEPRTFYGIGRFDVDFQIGAFSTRTSLTERELFSDYTDSGTGWELIGSGNLSSTDGTFSGVVLYSGIAGDLPGTLNGRFYGPDASELGAAFSGANGGNTMTGAIVGRQDSGVPQANLTLTNLVRPELISTDHAYMVASTGEPIWDDSQLYLRPDGSLEFTSSIPGLESVALGSDALVTSADPNFTAYEKTSGGQTVRLEMYKAGPGNTELQLTYASFGQWQSAPEGSALADADRVFFAYGLQTPAGVLAARTGSAHYEGVAYGAAFNDDTSTRYNVTGTSRFDVDFSATTFSGDLTLAGTATNGAPGMNFGKYEFGGAISTTHKFLVPLHQDGTGYGSLRAGFYGPKGEEIAGSFQMILPNADSTGLTTIVGATVARQR